MKHSNLTPEWLDEATAEEIAALPPATLDTLRTYLDDDMDRIKQRMSCLEGGITTRYGERARAAFAPKGGTGTVHVEDDDYDITVNADKKVEWDSDGLLKVLDAMDPALAKHYAKLEASIPEAKYKNVPPDIQKEFAPFRTVKPGKWKFSLKKREKEAA